MSFKQPHKLIGKFVTLESLNELHREELRGIAHDESVWTYIPTSGFGENFNRWFDSSIRHLKNGEHFPFVVRSNVNQQVIGTTRYYDLDFYHKRLAIGSTLYLKDVRGTSVNPESKFLLLMNAFEAFACNRVEFITDIRNLQSRAAIKKLGAKEEGVIRSHLIFENGYIRDSLMFSIIKSEWPVVKENLQLRLFQY